MNVVVLMGRLVRDPEVRYSAGQNATAVARFRIAVDRRFKRDGQQDADFFTCVAFGRQGEFIEKYLHQGSKVVIQGRIQNDNYTDKDGRMVYGQQIIVENVEFAESKAAAAQSQGSYRAPADPAATAAAAAASHSAAPDTSADGFMNIPDGIDEELPFN